MSQGGVLFALASLLLAAGPKPHRAHDRIAAGAVVVAAGETVRTAISFGGDVTLEEGARARSVVAFGGSVVLEAGAHVDRDVTALGGDVEIAAGAVVERDASAWGGKIEVENGGRVAGQIKPHASGGLSLPGLVGDDDSEAAPSPWGWAWLVLGAVTELVALLALGGLVVLVFPGPVDLVAREVGDAPFRSLLVGLLASLALPFLLVFSAVAILLLVGLLLLPLEAFALAAAWLLGHTAFAVWVGRRLRPRSGSFAHLAFGTVCLELLSAIPFLGPILRVLIWCLVFGAVLRTRFGTRPARLSQR